MARASGHGASRDSTAVLSRGCWAGAAAAAAGCGLAGAAYLLASARRASAAVAGVFGVQVPKKNLLLLLLHNGRNVANRWVLGRGRQGRACCCTSLWTCSCLSTDAFAGLARVLEPPICLCSAWACVLCAQC